MASTSVQSKSDFDLNSNSDTTAARMMNNNSSNSSRSWRKKSRRSRESESKGKGSREAEGRWKTEKQQEMYSWKLMEAVWRVRVSGWGASGGRRGRAVREAAERVLAVEAKGRSRWSRAILRRRRMRKVKLRKRRSKGEEEGGRRRRRGSVLRRLKGKRLGAVQRKVKVLGRLVPGCRKETLPVILEEATDYIAALQMQVRAMSALAHLLSSSTSPSV